MILCCATKKKKESKWKELTPVAHEIIGAKTEAWTNQSLRPKIHICEKKKKCEAQHGKSGEIVSFERFKFHNMSVVLLFFFSRCYNNKIVIFVMHNNLCHVLRGANQQNAILLSCKLLVKAKTKKNRKEKTTTFATENN